MRLSPLHLTFLIEICLLGLASFPWRHFILDLFGDFIPKGENVGRICSQNKLVISKVGRNKPCVNIGREDQKGRSLI
jgi:hypothetical protein